MKKLVRNNEHFIFICLVLFTFTVPLSIAVSEAVFVLALIGWGVKVAQEKKIHWQKTPLNLPILVFVVAAFLSSFWGIDVKNSLIGFRTYGLILSIFLLLNNVEEIGKVRILIGSLISGMSVLSVFTIVTHLSKIAGGIDPPLTGSMSEAGQLLIVIGITTAILLYQKGRKVKILLAAALLVMILAEILNFKRGSWIALVFVLIIQCWFKSRKMVLAVIFAAAAVFMLCQPVRDRLLSIRDELSTSRGGRLAMWETIPAILKDHPMGVGIDNVGSVMYQYNPAIESGHDHLHSTCPQILVEMGPAGLAAFLWWTIVFIRVSHSTFRRIRNENSFEKALALGSFSVFIGFLVNGVVEFNFGDSEVVMLIYFLMGMTLWLNRIKQSPKPPLLKGE